MRNNDTGRQRRQQEEEIESKRGIKVDCKGCATYKIVLGSLCELLLSTISRRGICEGAYELAREGRYNMCQTCSFST